MKSSTPEGAKKILSYEARRLKNVSSMLAALADNVSRDTTDFLDVPRELRRTAVSLEDGAKTLERIASVERECPWRATLTM